jgi:NitT/TauT family transport system permease protein
VLSHSLVIQAISLTIVLGIWEYAGGRIDPIFLAPPSDIAGSAGDMISSGELQRAMLDSLYHLAVGLTISIVIGITVGFLMGRYRLIEDLLDSFVSAAYVAPTVAFVPLMIIWFGIGSTAKIFVIVASTVFPILISTLTGVKNVSYDLLALGRAVCLSERQLLAKVILPAALPHVIVGLRLSIGRGVTNMVVAEFLTELSGLGGLVLASSNFFRTADMFVAIVTLMLTGLAFSALIGKLEQRTSGWRDTERASR